MRRLSPSGRTKAARRADQNPTKHRTGGYPRSVPLRYRVVCREISILIEVVRESRGYEERLTTVLYAVCSGVTCRQACGTFAGLAT